MSARRTTAARLAPWAGAAALFAVLFTLALLRNHGLEARYDAGYFRQAAFLISEGRDPYITIRGLPLLADHLYLVMFPVGWLTRVLPDLPTMFGLQAAALALAVVPLHHLARRHAGLGAWGTGAVLFAYAAHPALHNVNLADFHPETLAVPALVGAVLFALSDRWLPYGACVGWVLLCREDLAIVVAGLGLLLLIEGRRREGLVTVAVAATWFAAAAGISGALADGEYVQATLRLPQFGDSTGEIVWNMLTHPHDVVFDLATRTNVETVVALLAPLLFLPLVAPRYLLPAVPLQVVYLISNVDLAHTIEGHYTTAFVPFAAVAAAMGLGRVVRHDEVGRPRRVPVLLAVAAAASFYLYASAIPFADLDRWTERDAADRALLEAVDRLPDDAAVSAHIGFLPYAADRTVVFTYPRPFADAIGLIADPVSLAERVRSIDHVLIDQRALGAIYGPLEAQVLDELREEEGFRLTYDEAGIQLYQR